MYLLRHLIDALLMPLVVALIFGAVGGVLWLRGRHRPGARFFMFAAAVAYLACLAPVGDALLGPLERQYSPLSASGSLPDVGYIVVLGSSYSPRNGIPVSAALDEDGLARVVEGIRIARSLNHPRLVVSGGAPDGRTPTAIGYAKLAGELGVDSRSILMLDWPLNTDAEAHAVVALVGTAPFILVTSAYHMPRAMRLMERVHAKAIPTPTAQKTGATYSHPWEYILPSSLGLGKVERAVHEYVALGLLAFGFG